MQIHLAYVRSVLDSLKVAIEGDSIEQCSTAQHSEVIHRFDTVMFDW